MTENSSNARTVLITGAAKRIGRALAEHAAKAGYNVALHCNHSVQEAQELAQALRARHGVKTCVVQADLTDPQSTENLIDDAALKIGAIHALVNNASVFARDEIDTADAASRDLNMTVNLYAPLTLIRGFAAALPANETGAIVNMLDARVLNLTPRFTTYTLSKAGLATLTKTAALALAPRIRVNGVAIGDALPAAHQSREDFIRRTSSSPLGAPAALENIAAAVLFLLQAGQTTGTILPVDSGRSLEWSPEQKRFCAESEHTSFAHNPKNTAIF